MPEMRQGQGLDIDIEFFGIAALSLEGFDVMRVDVIGGYNDGFPSHVLD